MIDKRSLENGNEVKIWNSNKDRITANQIVNMLNSNDLNNRLIAGNLFSNIIYTNKIMAKYESK